MTDQVSANAQKHCMGAGLRAAAAFLVLSGFLSLATVRGYGLPMLLAPAILLPLWPIGEVLDRRYPLYRIVTKAISIAYFCFIPFTAIVLGLLNAVVALVVFITAHTLWHTKTPRNYYHLLLMAFFLVLAACSRSPEPSIAVTLFVFLVSSVWMLMALGFFVEMMAAHRGRQGDLIAVVGSGPDDTAGGRKLAFHLGVSVVVVAAVCVTLNVLFFLFTPRIEAGFLGRPESQLQLTGLSDEVDLTGGAFVQESFTAVMRVEFPDEPGGLYTGPMYWRSSTLPQFDGRRWTRKGLRQHYEPGIAPLFTGRIEDQARRNPFEIGRSPLHDRRVVRQVIYMDQVPEEGMPCLDLVQRVRLMGNPSRVKILWDGDQDFSVEYSTTGPRNASYEVWSEVGEPAPPGGSPPGATYRQSMDPRDLELLTRHTLSPQVLELVRRVTAQAQTSYDQAAALTEWLSGPDFVYTLDLPALPPQNPMNAFILRVRRGHCEMFASALALMLRGLGIPTRLASGFRGGDWNPNDLSYTVRGAHAHLWVEVWFPDHGWVVFDPSPREDDSSLSQMEIFARSLSTTLLKSKMLWYREVIGFDRGLQIARLRQWSSGLIGTLPWFEEPTRALDAPDHRLWPAGLALFAVLATTILFGAARAIRRRRGPYLLTADQARALNLYRTLRRKLARRGLAAREDTAEELRERVHTRAGAQADTALAIIDTYNAVRFGGRPLPAPDYARLRRQLRGWHGLESEA